MYFISLFNQRKFKKRLFSRVLYLLAPIFITTFLLGCADTKVVARTWETPTNPNDFPEISGTYAVPGLNNRPSFGIAISGGGVRSATAGYSGPQNPDNSLRYVLS